MFFHDQSNFRVKGCMVLAVVSLTLGCQIQIPNAVLRYKAREAQRQSHPDVARAYYEKAVRQDATDWRALYQIAMLNMKQERWVDAQYGFEQVLSLQPQSPKRREWMDHIAQCLFKQGRTKALRQMLANANAEYGQSGDYLRQANYLAKLGDIDQAKIAYRKAAQFADEKDAEPYLAMVAFYEMIGDQEHAIESLRRAHAIRPQDPKIASRLRHYGIIPGPAAGLPREKLLTPP